MGQRNKKHKKSALQRAGRLLRTETLERREVLSGTGLGVGLAAAAGDGPQATSGDCEPAQVGSQDGTQAQQKAQSGQMAQVGQSETSQQQSNQEQKQQGDCTQVAAGTLEELEADELTFMREEEKLARDVYLVLGEQYDVNIFDNIAESEQSHMDAVGKLIDKYGLEDPVGENGIGVFENAELQDLYNELIAKGTQSLADAYEVGIIIENADIEDLVVAIADTDNADIQNVYSSLLAGSQNHLEAFTTALDNLTAASTSAAAAGTASALSGVASQQGQQTQSGQESQTAQQTQLAQQAQSQTCQQDCDSQTQQKQRDKSRDAAFAAIGSRDGVQIHDRDQDQLSTPTGPATRSRLGSVL